MREVVKRALGFALGIGIVALCACESTYYDEYRAAHPGFDPELPRVGATLPELLAALYAPNPRERIEVALDDLAIFEVGAEGWAEIPFEDVRRGRAVVGDGSTYAVLVAWSCTLEQGLRQARRERVGAYLLPDNRLQAYDHYAFRSACAASNEFRAARGALIPVEREAFARLADAGSRFSLVQAYQRGLAYVEAGRLEEARAMLVIGERSYRQAVAQLRASGRPDAVQEAERLRASLMRALGLEERPQGDPR